MSNVVSIDGYRKQQREALERRILEKVALELKQIDVRNEWAAEEKVLGVVDVVCYALSIPNKAAEQEAESRKRFPEYYAKKDAEQKKKKIAKNSAF